LDRIRVFYRYSDKELEDFLMLAKLNTRMPQIKAQGKKGCKRTQKKDCRRTQDRFKAREGGIFKSTMQEEPKVVKAAIKYKKDQEIIFI
jgi:hypothetical protein